MDTTKHDPLAAASTTILDFAFWLRSPAVAGNLSRAIDRAGAVVDRIHMALADAARSYDRAVERDRNGKLASALAGGNLHRADVEGLRSLGAPRDAIDRAEVGGRARRKVHVYRAPIEIFAARVAAFHMVTTGLPDASPRERRAAFEMMPFRDDIIHAVVRSALDTAGPGNADAGFDAAANSVKAAQDGRMTGTTRSGARTVYRRVARCLKAHGHQGFTPITPEAFEAWIMDGVVPASL